MWGNSTKGLLRSGILPKSHQQIDTQYMSLGTHLGSGEPAQKTLGYIFKFLHSYCARNNFFCIWLIQWPFSLCHLRTITIMLLHILWGTEADKEKTSRNTVLAINRPPISHTCPHPHKNTGGLSQSCSQETVHVFSKELEGYWTLGWTTDL